MYLKSLYSFIFWYLKPFLWRLMFHVQSISWLGGSSDFLESPLAARQSHSDKTPGSHCCQRGSWGNSVCPLLDVSGSWWCEQTRVVWGEAESEDVLRNGLAAQYHLLLPPVPQRQHVVGFAPHAGQQLPILVEVHTAIRLLCTAYRHAG